MTIHARIAVGIDGSSRGDDALAFATALAASVGSGVLLAHAYGPGEDRERAHAILEAARAAVDAVPVETVAYSDPSPARALHRVAAARRAALVVVGPSHRAGMGLVLPGSTGQQLLQESLCAVAVVPRGWRPVAEAPLRHVGCGYDGSPEAQAALALASDLTRALGGELDVLRASWPARPGGDGIDAAAGDEARARAGLAAAVRSLPRGIHARETVLRDDPRHALVARSRDVDLLVLGSRGKGPLTAIWAGSVSSRVLREAACPVIVVPRGVHSTLVEPLSPTPEPA